MSPPPAEQFAARIFVGPALRAQPDRRLVDLVRDGYDAAFEEIVRRYRKPLDRFAAGIVGGRSEDVTQDAFSKALAALRGSEAEIELRPWLYRIVRNTALNELRDRAPEAEELPETVPGGRSTAAAAESREELRDLMQRLQALPEPQRAAIVMRELEGLSHQEIAAALGVSGGAARQAIHRARTALRDGLGLLLPLPLLRLLADYGGEAAAGGAIATGAGASSAGGAILGGFGGGAAVKAGVATALVAGAVGAGVGIEQRGGEEGRGAAAAQAASSPEAQPRGSAEGPGSPGSDGGRLVGSDSDEDSGGHGGDDQRGGERGDDDRRGGGRGEDGHGRDGADRRSPDGRSGGGDERASSSGPGSRRGSESDDLGDDNRSGPRSGSSSGSSSGSGSSPGSGSSGSSGPSGSGSADIEEGSDLVEDSSGSAGGGEVEIGSVEELDSVDSSDSGSGSSDGDEGLDDN